MTNVISFIVSLRVLVTHCGDYTSWQFDSVTCGKEIESKIIIKYESLMVIL